VKRLLDEPDASLSALSGLLESAEPLELGPFAKRTVRFRISRALSVGGAGPRLPLRPGLLGGAGLLVAAAAAAMGYSLLSRPPAPAVVAAPPHSPAPLTPPVAPPAPEAAPEAEKPAVLEAAPEPEATTDLGPAVAPSPKRNADKPRAGEDPTQVAEAVRALRKQGDFARAQALLEQYLKHNPHGALAEDALALSIEAAAARKDPRAADYARRYLARYPKGRFRAVAERALSR
jgi:TolA-binding protein